MRFLVDECMGPAVAKYSDKLTNDFIIPTEKTVRIVEERRDENAFST